MGISHILVLSDASNDFSLAAASGSFSPAGSVGTSIAEYGLDSAASSFSHTGSETVLTWSPISGTDYVLDISSASFSHTGSTQGADIGDVVTGTSATYNHTGSAATLDYFSLGTFTLDGADGTFSHTGSAATLVPYAPDVNIDAEAGSFSHTGSQVLFDTGDYDIDALAGVYSIQGGDAELSGPGASAPSVSNRFVTFENTLDGSVLGTSCVDSFQVNGDPNNFDASGAVGQTLCLYDSTHVYNPAGLSNARSAKLLPDLGGATLGGEPAIFVQGPATSAINLPIGTEIWYQVRLYPNQSYVDKVGAASFQGMKFLRGNGTSNFWGFYNYRKSGSPSETRLKFDTFGVTERCAMWAPNATDNGRVQVDTWNTYEIYMKVGNTTANSEIRFWKDHQPCLGYLISFPGPVYTLNTDGSGYSFKLPVVASGGTIKSYWRTQGTWNASPNPYDANTACWIDSIVSVHNPPSGSTQPAKTDSNGFPYIGDWENG